MQFNLEDHDILEG